MRRGLFKVGNKFGSIKISIIFVYNQLKPIQYEKPNPINYPI